MRRLVAVPVVAGLAIPAFAAVTGHDAPVDGWHLLGQIELEEIENGEEWSVIKRFPPELEDGAPVFEISGYLVPVGFGAETTDFMLMSEAGMCPFCGSADHGTAIEVSMAIPMPAVESEQRVTLRGALHAVRDTDTLQAVVMTDAVAL